MLGFELSRYQFITFEYARPYVNQHVLSRSQRFEMFWRS